MKSSLLNISAIAMAAVTALAVGGCSGGGSSSGTARATFLIGADSGSARSAVSVALRGGAVPIEDIESLTVTVTEIVLQQCSGGSGEDGPVTVEVGESTFEPTAVTVERGESVRWVWTTDTPHTITSGEIGDLDAGSAFDLAASTAGAEIELIFEDEGSFPYFSDTETDIAVPMAGSVNVVAEDAGGDDDGNGGLITVFEGAFDVNILDLTQLSEVLTSVEIPAGEYCKIRISIENPRLVLKADPSTVLTNVHLTANGRLFIQDHWAVEDGQEVLILVNFGGIHLVEAGSSGKYVFTPQLRADVEVTEAAVAVNGTITAVDPVARTIQVQTDGDTIEVAVSDATAIATDDDSDDAVEGGVADVALVFENLAVGQRVEVTGLLTVSGPVDALSIRVDDASFDTTP